MKRDDMAGRLLAACSARLDTDAGPQGTAFFVAPGFAITAAHVVGSPDGLGAWLSEGPRSWRGHVADVRPRLSSRLAATSPYPAPDVALIELDEGPQHACALLGKHPPRENARVMARGYTRTLDRLSITAETETGMLETTDPDCRLLKLGLGEVTRGMSGAPVLELRTGEVIGMLRTSRKLDSNLGGWVVAHLPAPPPASGLGKLNRSRRPLPATRGGLKGTVSDAGLLPLYSQVPTVLLACSRSVGEGRR
jgi:hypothetical protein